MAKARTQEITENSRSTHFGEEVKQLLSEQRMYNQEEGDSSRRREGQTQEDSAGAFVRV